MNQWASKTAKSSPVGTVAFLAIVFTAASFPLFHLFGQPGVVFVVLAYLLLPPAVVCGLYSILFEKSKLSGLAGLAVLAAMFSQRSVWILFDGLLLLPFYVLVFAAIAKIVERRRTRAKASLPSLQS